MVFSFRREDNAREGKLDALKTGAGSFVIQIRSYKLQPAKACLVSLQIDFLVKKSAPKWKNEKNQRRALRRHGPFLTKISNKFGSCGTNCNQCI